MEFVLEKGLSRRGHLPQLPKPPASNPDHFQPIYGAESGPGQQTSHGVERAKTQIERILLFSEPLTVAFSWRSQRLGGLNS